MPTEAKRQAVAKLVEQIKRCTVAIATDFTGLRVNEITDLRRRLRERSVEYRVVKNRLALLAVREAGNENFAELFQGVTGVAFGYGEPSEAAKALDEYIKATRSTLVVRNAVMEGQMLSAAQVSVLAALPSKNEMLARLLAQMQAPTTRLVTVLHGTIQGLAIVLQRRAEQLGAAA